jgi:hypothetical protein
MSSESRVLFSCFAERGGADYVCEVYSADSGYAEDFCVFVLMSDGRKGDAVDISEFEEEVQDKYYGWVTSDFSSD